MGQESEQLLGELLLFFLNNFDNDLLFSKRKHADHSERVAIDMFNRINDVKTVFDRLQKYPVYFESFYVHDKELISDAEAIEYHLHSYLQDFYILQERLIRIIGHIKRDLKTFELDHDKDLKRLLDHLSTQVHSVLNKITSGSRKKHVHDSTVRDSDLSNARLADIIKKVDPALVTLLTKKSETLTTKARNHYIQEAKRNADHIEMLEEFIVPRLGIILAHVFELDDSKFRSAIQGK